MRGAIASGKLTRKMVDDRRRLPHPHDLERPIHRFPAAHHGGRPDSSAAPRCSPALQGVHGDRAGPIVGPALCLEWSTGFPCIEPEAVFMPSRHHGPWRVCAWPTSLWHGLRRRAGSEATRRGHLRNDDHGKLSVQTSWRSLGSAAHRVHHGSRGGRPGLVLAGLAIFLTLRISRAVQDDSTRYNIYLAQQVVEAFEQELMAHLRGRSIGRPRRPRATGSVAETSSPRWRPAARSSRPRTSCPSSDSTISRC